MYVRGHAAYHDGVKVTGSDGSTKVGATYYMTYHSVLKTDQQYIDALNFSLYIADTMQDTIAKNCSTCHDIEVIPYRFAVTSALVRHNATDSR